MGTMITTAFKKVMIEQIVILLLSAAIIKQLFKAFSTLLLFATYLKVMMSLKGNKKHHDWNVDKSSKFTLDPPLASS